MTKEIHIQLNRRRLLIQIILLTLLGFGTFMAAFTVAEQLEWSPVVFKAFGVVVLVFSIITAGQKVKKRGERNGGLVINKEGINDLSSDIGVGMVYWKDISELDNQASRNSRLIVIHVKHHNDYLKKAKNVAVERLLRQNIRKFNTPVVIDPKYLNRSFDEILQLLAEEIGRRKK